VFLFQVLKGTSSAKRRERKEREALKLSYEGGRVLRFPQERNWAVHGKSLTRRCVDWGRKGSRPLRWLNEEKSLKKGAVRFERGAREKTPAAAVWGPSKKWKSLCKTVVSRRKSQKKRTGPPILNWSEGDEAKKANPKPAGKMIDLDQLKRKGRALRARGKNANRRGCEPPLNLSGSRDPADA